MKKLILFTLFLGLTAGASAQQTALFSQYLTNYYINNPAAAGENNELAIAAGYRMQWIGFEGAPRTFYLSGHSRLGGSRRGRGGMARRRRRGKSLGGYHAAGGYLFRDETGPTSRTGFNMSYAYHLPLADNITNSVGITVGAQQYYFDMNKIHLANNTNDIDPVAMQGSQKAVIPDLSVGYYIHAPEFFAGFSLAQALGNKIFDMEYSADVTSKLYRHLFFCGGYNIIVDPKLTLTPATMVRYVSGAPTQADISFKASYNFDNRRGRAADDKVWGAVTYRTQDAAIAMLGIQFLERYELAYSYDFTLSEIKAQSAGSHEIVIGLRLAR